MSANLDDEGVADATAEIAWPEPELELILRKPVEFKGETYDRLRLREPTLAEWERIFAEPAATRRRYAVATMSGVPTGAVAQMGIGDVVLAEDYLNSFFEVGQAIGARSRLH